MKNKEISALIAKSRAYNSSSFLLRTDQNDSKPHKTSKNIAFLAPKKVFKTAVSRNKARRRVKNALTKVVQGQISFKNKVYFDNNFIFSLKKGVLDIEFPLLCEEVSQALSKII